MKTVSTNSEWLNSLALPKQIGSRFRRKSDTYGLGDDH